MIKSKAIEKVQTAIDKMIDLKDSGWDCERVQRILEALNELENAINFDYVKRTY